MLRNQAEIKLGVASGPDAQAASGQSPGTTTGPPAKRTRSRAPNSTTLNVQDNRQAIEPDARSDVIVIDNQGWQYGMV